MNTIESNSASEPQNINLTEKKEVKRNVWLAAFFNFIAPGLGYFYCGKIELSIIAALSVPFFNLFTAFISTYLPTRLNVYFYLFTNLAIVLGLIIHASIIALKTKKVILKPYNKIIYYFLFFICFAYYSNVTADSSFKTFNINLHSMENTLFEKERILVRMNYYGLYIPSMNKKICKFDSPKREDVVVYFSAEFNKNGNYDHSIHRIIAQPGDSIKISNKICYVNGIMEKQNPLYIYDSIIRDTIFRNPRIYPKDAPWNEDNYGPLYIPKAGDKILINATSIKFWEQLILQENQETKENVINQVLNSGEYIIKKNYYFLMGDNRNNSYDSRFRGLVPEDEIVGKVEFIIPSLYNYLDLLSEKSRIGMKMQ